MTALSIKIFTAGRLSLTLARALVVPLVISGFLASCTASSKSNESDGPSVAAGAAGGAAGGLVYSLLGCLGTGPGAPICAAIMAPVGVVTGGIAGGVAAGSSGERGPGSAGPGTKKMLRNQHKSAIQHRDRILQRAEAGEAEAMADLATMYEHSLTVGDPVNPSESWITVIPKDYVQAYKWRTLANFCGSPKQIPLRIKLSGRMSSGQIGKAEQLVSEWHAEGNACAADANDVASAAN